jgi:tetratricopeptide (TPR) repeat protein
MSTIDNEEIAMDDFIKTLEKQISEEPDEFRRDGMTAQLLVAQGKHVDALSCFERAVLGLRVGHERKPLLWSDYFVRILGAYAMTLDYLGELERAEDIYKECLAVNPAGFFLGEYAVFLHRRKRDFVQAQAYYERSLELYPTQSAIHLKFAAFLRHVRRDLKLAEYHYKMSIESNPRNPDALGSYASFLHGVSGNVDLAETYYSQAVDLDRTHANNLCNYGLFLSEEKHQYARAEDFYKQVLLHTPQHANTLYNYAVMLDSHLDGRKSDAEQYYRRAIEVEPRHAFALYNLAVLLEEKALQADFEDIKAHDRLRKLTKEQQMQQCGSRADNPQSPRGTAFESKMKRREDVCELYKRAHSADPKDVTTAADYGRYIVTKMVISRNELKENVQGSTANYTLANEQYLKIADAVLQGALDMDGKCIVALYNHALLYQKHKTDMIIADNGGVSDGSLLDNLLKAEKLLKSLLLETRGKHIAAMQQLGRVFVDKFKALNNKDEYTVIELAMECYENVIKMKYEKGNPNPNSSSSPQTALLEYLKIVSNFANNKQKMRAIGYIEAFMTQAKNDHGGLDAVFTQEIDIRQILGSLGTIVAEGKEPEPEKKRRS